ncbi:MAG: hypothetical protein EA398_02360 [Deltaproteobacteria bacterium]|nr:MAG: hypothetical protein EA398_02360 [Deltaproteobacteria bacterium]
MRSGDRVWMLLVVLALVWLVACDRPSEEEPSAEEATVEEPAPTEESAGPPASMEEAVRAAAEIRRVAHTNPAALRQTLQERGLTVEDMEQMLYRIAADREASMEYERLTGEAPR